MGGTRVLLDRLLRYQWRCTTCNGVTGILKDWSMEAPWVINVVEIRFQKIKVTDNVGNNVVRNKYIPSTPRDL